MRARAAVGTAGFCCAVVVLGSRPPEQEFWYVHYERALEAIDASAWGTALDELELAVDRRDDSSWRARTYGLRFVRYFPYFYRGIAQYNRGLHGAAMESFRQERERGEIQEVERYRGQLRVFLQALGADELTRVRELTREDMIAIEVGELLAEGRQQLEAGNHEGALGAAAAALALDRTSQDAMGLYDLAKAELLRAELEQIGRDTVSVGAGRSFVELDQRSIPAGGPSDREASVVRAPTRGPGRIDDPELEAKAWEYFRDGARLLEQGAYRDALVSFVKVMVFFEAGLLPEGRLMEMAEQHKQIAETEIAFQADLDRQAAVAQAIESERAPPGIALYAPTRLDQTITTETVLIQGLAFDAYGIVRVELETDETTWDLTLGAPNRGSVITRNIEVEQRPDGLGRHVRFHMRLPLQDGENRITILAYNIHGDVTRQELNLRVETTTTEIWAAVIGINDYQHPAIPSLRYAEADAEAVYTYLRENLGVPEDHIFRVMGDSATDDRLRTVLGTELRRRADEDDQVIIYFAGHGAPYADPASPDGDGLEKYLLTVNADPDDLYGTAFPMENVAQVLRRIRAERLVFLVDACYSGAAGGRSLPGSTRATISDGFLTRLAGSGTGRVIITASGANELSHELPSFQQGVFTYRLLEGLRGEADTDSNGLVTVDEAYAYVLRTVPDDTDQQQHPVRKGEVMGELILGRVVSAG